MEDNNKKVTLDVSEKNKVTQQAPLRDAVNASAIDEGNDIDALVARVEEMAAMQRNTKPTSIQDISNDMLAALENEGEQIDYPFEEQQASPAIAKVLEAATNFDVTSETLSVLEELSEMGEHIEIPVMTTAQQSSTDNTLETTPVSPLAQVGEVLPEAATAVPVENSIAQQVESAPVQVAEAEAAEEAPKPIRILHTADWHLGKNLHGKSMIEEQIEILKQIVFLAQREKVDAVIIAGDLYDKPIASIESTKVLEETLYQLNVAYGLPVFAISGNHDSAGRLSFGSAWYEKSNLHVIGGLQKDLHSTILGDVEFWFVPYHDVQTARYVFGKSDIVNVDDAMRHIVSIIKEKRTPGKKQVLIGHAFVAGGLMSDSERSLSVGNVERVSLPVFDDFDYVALGHLHNPNAVTSKHIHYSGSPLKYSFSESNQEKVVKIVEFGEELIVEELPLVPMQDVRVIEGMLDNLIADPVGDVNDYIKVILEDEGSLLDPMSRLRSVYPNILHLERKTYKLGEMTRDNFGSIKNKDEAAVFEEFFKYTTGKGLTTNQKNVIEALVVDLKRGENE